MLRKTMLQWLNAAFVLSLITFSIFILAIPFFITELNSLELELELEIQETTKLVDRLWSEISNRNTNRYPRSTYDETADNIKSYVGPPSYSDAKPPSLPYTIPKYGYGYRKLKCCCSIDGYVSTNLPTSYKCPAGPPGPRGRKGYSGEDGTPGQPGLNGQNFFATVPNSYSYERPPTPPIPCAPCPCGPPGPPGPPGAMGLQGRKGVRGACGIPGFHGKPGEYGEPGDLGKRGRRGVPGYKGTPGSDGVLACKGAPGLPGVPGPSGACGPRGVEGSPGEFGLPGPAGACGMPGPAGMPGVNGIDGPPGREGKPGRDAEYCSCPPKEHSLNIQPVASLQKPEKASTIYTGGDVSVAIPPRPTYTTISPDHSSSPSSAYRQQNQQRLKRIKETLQTRFIDWPTRNFNNIMMKHNEKDYGLERNLPGERKHLY